MPTAQTLLKSGKITRAEFERRKQQSLNSQRRSPAAVKSKKPQQQQKRAPRQITQSVPRSIRESTFNPSQVIRTPRMLDTLGSAYHSAIIDPLHYISRIPDSYNKRSGVFRSVSTMMVPLKSTGGTDFRFAGAVQPIIGSTSTPASYQVALANVDTLDWNETDWSSPSSYLASSNGRDPRIDVNAPYLTQPADVYYEATCDVTDPTLPQASLPGVGNFFGPDVGTLAVDPKTSNPNIIAFTPNRQISLPQGSYHVTVSATFTVSNVAGLAYPKAMIGNTQGQVIPIDNTAPVVSAALGAVVTSTSTYIVSVPFTSGVFSPCVVKGLPGTTPLAANDISDLNTKITIVSVTPNGMSAGTSSGVIEEIRPVAQSVLVTYMGPTLSDGGLIAMAYVEKDFLDSNFFSQTTSNPQGQAQLCENLMGVEGAYNGRLSSGAYGWWSPFGSNDTAFRPVGEMNLTNFPSIVFSGVFAPTGLTTATTSFTLRLEVCTTFEFLTKSTAFNMQHPGGSQATIDMVQNSLRQQPHCMANGSHTSWISSLIRGGTKILRDNRDIIRPLAQAGMMALL